MLMYVIIGHYPVHPPEHTQVPKADWRPSRCATPARYPVHRPPFELISEDEHEEGHSDPRQAGYPAGHDNAMHRAANPQIRPYLSLGATFLNARLS
jgi:hypothetical protein